MFTLPAWPSFYLMVELPCVDSPDPRGLLNYEFGMHPLIVVALHKAADLPLSL